ncbi:MAG: integrase [Crocinitomicaceae bacterium]|jgi:integrase
MEWNTMIGLTDRIKRDQEYRDYLLITMGCYFGLRISDLLSLKWNDVINKEELNIQESKTKKTRTITFNEKVIEAINICSNELRLENGHWNSEYIFANRWGGQLSTSYINKRLKIVFTKYNVRVQNPSSHTLRKTFGKRVYEMDGQSDRALIYLSDIFGHSSTSITRSYIGITQDQIKDVYLNL